LNPREAARLIAGAIVPRAGIWADLGAGEGTFTRALASLLEPGSRIFAVDRDARALEVLRRHAREAVRVLPVNVDFTQPFEWPGLGDEWLDGMLFANALHFVPDPAPVLAHLVARLKTGGRVVIVEYDRRGPNPWVPNPIPFDHLAAVTNAAGLSTPVETARRPSAFGGDLYVAVADRL
jgi:SAM-dependent methyltransferase